MSEPAKIDFNLIPVIDVARELFGQEARKRSTVREKHFPDNSGLFVNVQKNKWYSHGDKRGGDVVSLVQFATGCDFKGALSWLRSRGHLAEGQTPQKRITAEYDYVSRDGEVLYQVLRYDPKDFRQRRPYRDDWAWGLKEGTYKRSTFGGDWHRLNGATPRLGCGTAELSSVTPVPYRLPELLQSGECPVLIAGGEKDVDNLRGLGFTATCNHGGEGKWWSELTRYFQERRVCILCDNDTAGENHQAIVGAAIEGTASEIRVVRFLELPKGGDVSDWIELRRKDGLDDTSIAKELTERLTDAPKWEPRPQAPTTLDTEEWSEPLSLPDGLSPVSVLDPALLPAAIGPWVGDISERMQCPPDYVGVAALVALGSVLGRKVGIRPQRKTDWFEVANLWGCVVGRPGLLKSPAINEALKPLHHLEMKARETYDAEKKEYGKEHKIWKMRMEEAEAKAKRALKNNPSATTLDFDFPEPEEPIDRRYVTNDTTYEKLGEILAQNPNGVLAHRDELVSLLKTLDREEFAAARGFFLTAWNGTTPYKFDRITRGKTHIDAACLSLLGSTQPGRLADYVRRALTGGAGDDGLIQRFGLLVWPDQNPEWRDVDRYPDSEAREAAWRVFVSFDSLQPGDIGAETDQFDRVPFLRFDSAAQDDFLEWRKDLESKLRSGQLPAALESHLAKSRKLVPSLALISHLADGGTGPVTQTALLRALGLAEYAETHALRVYGAGSETEIAAAKAILSHIRKGDVEDNFCARDVHRRGWSRLSDRDQVQSGLNLLCDLDWIVAEDKRSPAGGRPTTLYRINPRARQ
jgi:Protein of unknown function (DUF3987)